MALGSYETLVPGPITYKVKGILKSLPQCTHSVMLKYNYSKDAMIDLCALFLLICSDRDKKKVSSLSKHFLKEEPKGKGTKKEIGFEDSGNC